MDEDNNIKDKEEHLDGKFSNSKEIDKTEDIKSIYDMADMENENEEEQTSILEEKKYDSIIKKHKKTRFIKRIIFIVVILITIVMIFYSYFNKKYSGYRVVKEIKKEDTSLSKYEIKGERIYKYNKDGIIAIDLEGSVLWSGAYNMDNPRVETCGEYTAVADIGGKEVLVYDKNGNSREIKVAYSITKVQIACQGVTALMVEAGDADHILVYNPISNSKDLLYDMRTITQEDGFPVDMALSMDGSKIVTSYLMFKNGIQQSMVTFYNLGEVGENKTNRIVGAIPYKQVIVPKVQFVNNNVVCLYKDNGFSLYKMKQLSENICNINFKENIKSCFSNNKYIGFVLENLDTKEKYKVVLYNLSGKKVLDKNIDYEYDKVYMIDDEIIFYSDLEAFILRSNGKEKYRGTFDKKISYIFPSSGGNRYLLINDSGIDKIKLVEEKIE